MRHLLMSVAALVICLCVLGGCVAAQPPAVMNQVTVTEATSESALVGKRVTVLGVVAPDSWNGQSNPMVFSMLDPLSSNNARITVTFDGPVPDTFGATRGLRVVGTLNALGRIEASQVGMEPVDRY